MIESCTLDIGPEINQRIIDMAKYIEKQIAKGIKRSTYFVIQFDKSTDVREHAILFCFMRYSEDEHFREEPLYCFDLSGQTTSSEISGIPGFRVRQISCETSGKKIGSNVNNTGQTRYSNFADVFLSQLRVQINFLNIVEKYP